MNGDFSLKLKTLRKRHGITQEALGKLLDVKKSTISNYEKGVSMPDSEKLIKLASFFCGKKCSRKNPAGNPTIINSGNQT